MFFKSKPYEFIPASFSYQKGVARVNPGRGFYHLFPFVLGDAVDYSYLETTLLSAPSLYLIEISLQNYPREKLPPEALNSLREIFSFFKEKGGMMILRCCYDLTGEAALKEPSYLELIFEHMEQVAFVVNEYKDYILLHQGIFIGNWGEMHGSRFLRGGQISRLYRKLRECLAPEIRIALRRYSFVKEVENSPELSVYNDGIFGSKTDMASFTEQTMELEISAMQRELPYGIFGGEVLYPQEEKDILLWETMSRKEVSQYIFSHLKELRISYLNEEYDTKQLALWDTLPPAEGFFSGDISPEPYANLRQQLEDFLGYQLMIKGASIGKDREGTCLSLVLSNPGFGVLPFSVEIGCTLLRKGDALPDENLPHEVLADGVSANGVSANVFLSESIGAESLPSDGELNVCVLPLIYKKEKTRYLPDISGTYEVILFIRRVDNKQLLKLSNGGLTERAPGRYCIGTFKVK